MPALVAHWVFGQSVLEGLDGAGLTEEETHAFLLGNQGPDPLFYSIRISKGKLEKNVGSAVHGQDHGLLARECGKAILEADESDRSLLHAFTSGLFCHFLLDASAHPLIYSLERRICSSGVFGFTEKDASIAHMVIERELDEMLLFTSTGKTVSDCNPAALALELDDAPLAKTSSYMASILRNSIGSDVSDKFYANCVKRFRWVQQILAHPRGFKFALASLLENLFLEKSVTRAMKLRPVMMERTYFANEGRDPWEDPFSGEIRTESYFDLCDQARDLAEDWTSSILNGGILEENPEKFSVRKNFSGVLIDD